MITEAEEYKKIIFHSLTRSISAQKGELSDYEVKEMIFRALDNLPEVRVKWANREKHGKNRLLVNHNNRIVILDLNFLMMIIKEIWREFNSEK